MRITSPSESTLPVTLRRTKKAANQRNRRLLLESLESRHLMAFDVLAEFDAGLAPNDFIVTQINGDAQPDLVILNVNRFHVRLGNVDGTFGEPLETMTSSYAVSIVAGDFNGDEVTDLMTVNNSSLTLLIGNGEGGFTEAQSFGLPAQESYSYTGLRLFNQSTQSIATGDLNDDGHLDLVVGGLTSFPIDIGCGYYSCGYVYGFDGFVNVLLGNGAGSFDYQDADPADVDLDAHPLGGYQTASALAILDVNDDGRLDVIGSKFYGGVVSLLGNGEGALGSPIHTTTNGTSSLLLADLDGDDVLDLLSRAGASLVVSKGNGNGSFTSIPLIPMDLDIDSAVMGDVNNDGLLDLVAVGDKFVCTNGGYYQGYYGYGYYCTEGATERRASVVLGNGQGAFSLPITSSLGDDGTSFGFIDVILAKLDDDALLDLVTIDSHNRLSIVAFNNGLWAPPAELDIAPVSIVEGHSGSTTAVLTVTLTGEYSEPVSVDYSTSTYYGYGAMPGEDYDAVSGTLVFPPGVHSQTITVPIYGDRKGEADEYLTINLANPEGALLRRGSAQVTILDDEPHVSIDHSFYDDPLNVVEGDVGNTPTEFTVTLSKAYDQEVTVDYYTSTGHINDIIAASGTLTFAPGETEKTITVQVINDLIHEDLEAFNVYLTNPSFNTYLGNGAGYCYIEDNDPLPTVSINDVSVTEGNSGTKTLTFTVTLSAIAQYEVGIDYTTSDGTATTANKDYVARSGAVYIDAGELTTTVKITVRGDTKSEQDELFFVNLLSAGGAAIADSHGVGTILNDDSGPIATPKLRIGNAAVTEGQSGTKLMQFTVTLSSASEAAVEVKYTTRNGTARVSNNDYQAASGTLTFAPGETTKTIFIEINGDKKKETDEFFYILLSSAKGASFADSLGKGIIRNDDSIR